MCSRLLMALGVVALAALTACKDSNGMDVLDVEVPDGFELSAGTATNFKTSTFAYDTEVAWLKGEYMKRFTRGDKLYDDARTSAAGYGGGLGPVQAGFSCGSCHKDAGRTMPTFGSGTTGFSSQLVYVTRKNGAFFQGYGRVLHDQSIYGVTPEGKLHVDWERRSFTFPDGEPYELVFPKYTITEWYADTIRPEDLFCTVRIPLRHVGMGQMMALDRDEIEALARQSDYPQWGISGRCNYITERGVRQLGLSGNKAQHADLTVELGFSSDMGVTNSRYPEEICEGQLQMQEGSMMGLAYDQLDISTEDMECVDLYMHCLSVPARRNVYDLQVKQGRLKFEEAGCNLCHTPTLHTRPRGATLLAGTQLPWLGGQTIHPYSDFLLHDMGSEIMGVGLNDNYVSGLAQGNEWRTTPLWGIGLQYTVNRHTYFLHDGRARNLTEAIMWHGGEGYASRQRFASMSKEERAALLKFVESL